MKFTENVEVSLEENLYIVKCHGYIKLYDKELGFLGNFEVWHDAENENSEYFNINDNKVFLDDITT